MRYKTSGCIAAVMALLMIAVDCVAAGAGYEDDDFIANIYDKAVIQTRRQDDKRPADQYRTYLFGRPLTIGGEYEIKPTYRKDFSLGRRDDDLLKVDQQIDIEILYEWSAQLSTFVEAKGQYDADFLLDDESRDTSLSLERGETWLYADNLFGGAWDFQFGRQNFQEKREWWWDEDLDAVRIFYQQGQFYTELGLAEDLWRTSSDEDLDPEDKDIFRLLGRARWEWAKNQRLGLFFLHQNDHSNTPGIGDILSDKNDDDTDADLTWLGLRALGRFKVTGAGKLYYWFDTGYVRGHESVIDFDDFSSGQIQVGSIERHRVKGWAVDFGATLRTRLPGRPSFTLGYAYGSGDDNPGGNISNAYQQTGLQDNNNKFRGVDRFRYYGELLRPELSNLQILTLSAGLPLLNSSSVEVLFHHYRQVEAADELRDASLKTDPDGSSRDIGNEVDLVLGLEEWKHLELELVLGSFWAGEAFGTNSGERASTAIFKLDYNF